MINLTQKALAVIVVSFFIFIFYDSYAKSSERKAALKANMERESRLISSAVKRFGADRHWAKKIQSSSKVIFKVTTLELETAWLDAPILFFAGLEDIKTLDDESYLVTTDSSSLSHDMPMFLSKVGLSLVAPKNLVDAAIKKSRSSGSRHYGDFSIIASIKKISSSSYLDDGDEVQSRTGHGKLLWIDIVQYN